MTPVALSRETSFESCRGRHRIAYSLFVGLAELTLSYRINSYTEHVKACTVARTFTSCSVRNKLVVVLEVSDT